MTPLPEFDSDPNADSPEYRDLDTYARERLAPHREYLERLAALDTALSKDAKKALQILEEEERGESPTGTEDDAE